MQLLLRYKLNGKRKRTRPRSSSNCRRRAHGWARFLLPYVYITLVYIDLTENNLPTVQTKESQPPPNSTCNTPDTSSRHFTNLSPTKACLKEIFRGIELDTSVTVAPLFLTIL
jgi:hypothetical protein